MQHGGRKVPFPPAFARFFSGIYAELLRHREIAAATGAAPTREESAAIREAGDLLERGFHRHFFLPDDSFRDLAAKYAILGEYALAKTGRAAGLERLLAEEGPAADPTRDHVERDAALEEQDWAWMRLNTRLYAGLAQQMLDLRNYPAHHDPDMARRLLERLPDVMARAREMNIAEPMWNIYQAGRLTLALLANDPELFREILAELSALRWSDHDDIAASTFGAYVRYLPADDVEQYAAIFRELMPDKQHHFKAAYRAFDQEAYAQARVLARSAALAFPDDPRMVREAEDFERMVDVVERRKVADLIDDPEPETETDGIEDSITHEAA
jgi:hypothetical protein